MFEVGEKGAEWASSDVHQGHLTVLGEMQKISPVGHWSRLFEYPWAFLKGDFQKGQWCLDAAGGKGVLQHAVVSTGAQVVNLDLNQNGQPSPYKGALICQGDLTDLKCLQSEMFDRVMCISALEHIIRPERAVHELWRVLRPCGRLIVTFDAASYARWNHTIDEEKAKEILSLFGLSVPLQGKNTLSQWFSEIDRLPSDPTAVELRVICFYADKKRGDLSQEK